MLSITRAPILECMLEEPAQIMKLGRFTQSRAFIHLAVRRLTAESREVSKLGDWVLYWLYRSEIWHLDSAAGVKF